MFSARQGFFAQSATNVWGNNVYFPGITQQFLSITSRTAMINWKNPYGYTIEYWGYWSTFGNSINGGPGNHNDNWAPGSGTNYWSFGPVIGGQLEFYYWGPGQQFLTTAPGLIPLNTWVNICAVFTTSGSNTTANLYINGIRQDIQWNKTGVYAQQQTVNNGVVSTGTVFGMGRYSQEFVGYYNNLRVSDSIARYSGSSYPLSTEPFVVDGNTNLLIYPPGINGSSTITWNAGVGVPTGTMTNQYNIIKVSSNHSNHT